MQDVGGVDQHGADLIFSTVSSGASGNLQDWLTITSSGVAWKKSLQCELVVSLDRTCFVSAASRT